jgi:hypothetical protein
MLNHHMPWSYDSLFAGYGEKSDVIRITDFQHVLPVRER